MFRYSLVMVAAFSLAGPGFAATWADALFEDLSRDFGSVPRGPTLTHSYRIKNKTNGPVRIAGVRVSCGCTTAQVAKPLLQPGEETAVEAAMDTRRFVGTKTVTIYVTFDHPAVEEVRLWIQANARDDVSVAPDTLAFGQVKRGAGPSATVKVALLGNSQYRITEATSESGFIKVTAKETQRTETEVGYDITAKLRADVPTGRWYSDVWLKTNHPAMPKIRVPLTVEVDSALSVSPSSVTLGGVKAGGEAERRVILRGTQPFKITDIKGVDDRLTVKAGSEESKTVHVLTVKVKGDKPGEWARTLRVITDLKEDNEIDFQAKVQVLAK